MSLTKLDIRLILLILFTITLPNSVAINNIILGLIIIYWIIKGDKKETFKTIKTNPIVFFSYLFFFSYIFSLLWSEDLKSGLAFIKKEIIFLILPILITLIKEKEKDLLIKLFIFSMTISEIISYSIKFQIIPEMFKATVYDPAPFMGHISYNPFLAFTIYLLFFYLFTSKESKVIKAISVFFIITMSINLFITGGRAGQVAFFIMLVVIFIQFFKLNFKNIILAVTFIGVIFAGAYNFSNIFNNRVNATLTNLKNFNQNPNSSIGKRVVFWKNTIELIKNNPILGVGIGDYTKEYRKIHLKNTPKIEIEPHPHNMYLFVWATGGLLSLFSLIAILLVGVLVSIKKKSKYAKVQTALIVLFAVIMFSDCYLLGHFTTYLFTLFSAILFKGVSWQDLKKS